MRTACQVASAFSPLHTCLHAACMVQSTGLHARQLRPPTYRCAADEASDVLRWVDRALVRLATKFGEYTNDQADTFTMPEHLALFPQFIFHLRRSQFLQVCEDYDPAGVHSCALIRKCD